MAFAVLSCTAVVLLTLSHSVSAARVKIHLEPNFSRLYADKTSGESACTDVVGVERSSLDLYGDLEELGEIVTFHRSAIATENLAVFTTMRVPGLDGQTIEDVFEVMQSVGCLPFYIGGAVRDQFLNRVPSDADVEVDCPIDYFVEVCIENWGESNCRAGGGLAHVGNNNADPDLRDMDIASTDSTFYVPITNLEYTVNSMAYDLNGNDVIIDLAGTGQVDACNKHIRIPSSDGSMKSWNAWLNVGGSILLYRYWKLRYKGLDAANRKTRLFIVTKTKNSITNDPSSFSDFYCHYVQDGDYDEEGNTCDVLPEDCEDSLSQAEAYNEKFAEDLGMFWIEIVYSGLLPSSNCE